MGVIIMILVIRPTLGLNEYYYFIIIVGQIHT